MSNENSMERVVLDILWTNEVMKKKSILSITIHYDKLSCEDFNGEAKIVKIMSLLNYSFAVLIYSLCHNS